MKRVILIVLALAAMLSLGLGARRAIRPDGSQDFQYSGARVMVQGQDPYALWLSHDKRAFFASQDPNYLPNFFYLISPLAVLDWPVARLLWMITNLLLAGYTAWLIYCTQKSTGDGYSALVIALLFLSSNPVRNAIGNGQHVLIIFVATAWALRWKSKPLCSGLAFSVTLAKYSFGLFYLAAEGACRRLVAPLVAGAVVLAGFAGLCLQDHVPLTLQLFLEPLNVAKTGESLTNHFVWINRCFGYVGVRTLPLIGLAVTFLCALRLASTGLPAKELDMKTAAGATFASLLFAPHLGYDFAMLVFPLAAGCRLLDLKKLERYVYGALLLAYWNIFGPLQAMHVPFMASCQTFFVLVALSLLTGLFLATRPNWVETRSA